MNDKSKDKAIEIASADNEVLNTFLKQHGLDDCKTAKQIRERGYMLMMNQEGDTRKLALYKLVDAVTYRVDV